MSSEFIIQNPCNERIEAKESNDKLPFAFLWIWTFVLIGRPQDYITFLIFLRPVAMISALTLISMILAGIKFPDGINRNREVRFLLIFFMIMMVGIPFAVHRGVAFHFVFSAFPGTLLYFIIFIILVNSEKRLNSVAWAAVAGAVFISLNYIKDTILAGNVGYRVYASQMYDPNDVAFLLVTYLPLTFYFFLVKHKFMTKIFFLLASISMAVSILIAQSRGGILAFAVIIIAMMRIKTDAWRGGRKFFVVILLLSVLAYYLPVAGERFHNIGSDYNVSDEKGRLNIWKQNLLILMENPIFGVGANCSSIALGLRRAENRDGVQAWQVPHSSIIEVAVETGVPGFIVYVLLNLGAIANLRRMRTEMELKRSLLPIFLGISFYGFWTSALFLTQGYSIHLFFLLAMSASMRNLKNEALTTRM